MYTPEQVVQLAHDKGLHAISITDHDTFCGTDRAKQMAKQLGVKYLVGAEISSMGVSETHILAFNVDYNAVGFAEELQRIANMRENRNKQIVAKLAQHGIVVNLDDLNKQGSVGRGLIAKEIVRLGYCKDNAEVFEKYLGAGKCCYVNSQRLTPQEAIKFVLRYGGIPVLAHPKQLHLNLVEMERYVEQLVGYGLAGIEAHYFTHTMFERNYYCRLARKYKLITTGGSDFHDFTHGVQLGTKHFTPNSYTRSILGV